MDLNMEININNLDLKQIADSGQCFRWKAVDDVYEVIAFDRCLRIKQKDRTFDLDCDEKEWVDIWSSYLDMDTDYESIGKAVKRADLAFAGSSNDKITTDSFKKSDGV